MPFTPSDIDALISLTQEAGRRILPFFRAAHGARKKADHSPVTDADMAAHDYLVAALAERFPAIPVISEEDALPAGAAPEGRYFLVDPLDGTRSFVRGEAEFTVNIGLAEGGKALFGLIGAPVQDVVYAGGAGYPARKIEGRGAPVFIRPRPSPGNGLIVTRSRSHASAATQAYLDTLNIAETLPASSAIKFCWVAEGRADIYPRFGRTMEWDTAAGHAILESAGGRVATLDGAALTYGKPNFENPGFIAYGA